MVASAVILLTVMHPGLVFEKKGWKEASWNFSGKPYTREISQQKLEKITGSSN
jgi:hypothetical protein